MNFVHFGVKNQPRIIIGYKLFGCFSVRILSLPLRVPSFRFIRNIFRVIEEGFRLSGDG